MIEVELTTRTFTRGDPRSTALRNTFRGLVDFDNVDDVRSHLQNGSWIRLQRPGTDETLDIRCSEASFVRGGMPVYRAEPLAPSTAGPQRRPFRG